LPICNAARFYIQQGDMKYLPLLFVFLGLNLASAEPLIIKGQYVREAFYVLDNLDARTGPLNHWGHLPELDGRNPWMHESDTLARLLGLTCVKAGSRDQITEPRPRYYCLTKSVRNFYLLNRVLKAAKIIRNSITRADREFSGRRAERIYNFLEQELNLVRVPGTHYGLPAHSEAIAGLGLIWGNFPLEARRYIDDLNITNSWWVDLSKIKRKRLYRTQEILLAAGLSPNNPILMAKRCRDLLSE
jgi:hypothetical protein